MKYGYARCSTNESKQDIERQVRELIALGVERKHIYMEYESGMKTDRIEWLKLLDQLKAEDILLTTEISRITRSTKQLCDILELAKEKRIRLEIGTFTLDCRESQIDPMTEGMLKMMGVFAEMERNMTVARIKSGLENAKAKGKKLGRPILSKEKLPSIFYRNYPHYLRGDLSKTDFARLCEVSRCTIYRWLAIEEEN